MTYRSPTTIWSISNSFGNCCKRRKNGAFLDFLRFGARFRANAAIAAQVKR
jgi:hypothetical protein